MGVFVRAVSSADRCTFLNRGVALLHSHGPETCEIVSDRGECELRCHFGHSTSTKLPHASLLFQYTEHRFHQRFPSRVHRTSAWTAQLRAQSPMHRIAHRRRCSSSRAPSRIQPPPQRRIRHAPAHSASFPSLYPLQPSNPPTPTAPLRPFPP